MTMRTQQRFFFNTLRKLNLVSIFLFANLCTCCNCNSFWDIDDKETNISLTSEYGSRYITAERYQIKAINYKQGWYFTIRISSNSDDNKKNKKKELTQDDLESVTLKVKNKQNVSQVMYVSAVEKTNVTKNFTNLTPKSYDPINNNAIKLSRLLAIYEFSSGYTDSSVRTNIVAIPEDDTLPCSLTLELEVDGKSIDEFVHVSGKSQFGPSGPSDDSDAPEMVWDFPPKSEELIQDHYAVLGIDIVATERSIKSNYYKLARKWHPDKSKTNTDVATKNFQKINLAYQVLSNSKIRDKWRKRRIQEGVSIK